jgi:endonuclease I
MLKERVTARGFIARIIFYFCAGAAYKLGEKTGEKLSSQLAAKVEAWRERVRAGAQDD